jgi:hypothetical protein
MPQKTPATRPGIFSNPFGREQRRASAAAEGFQSSINLAEDYCDRIVQVDVYVPRRPPTAEAPLDRTSECGSPRPPRAANDLNALIRDAALVGTRFLPGQRLLLQLLSPPPLHPFQDVLRQIFSIHDCVLPGKARMSCRRTDEATVEGHIVLARSRPSSSRRETFCSPGHY